MLWCNGELVDGPNVPFDLSDRGLLLGDGVFDTALAIDGRVVFEDAHVARLVASAETLGFPVSGARVVEAMRAVAGQGGHVAIRTTVTRGPGPRGIAPPVDAQPFLFARGTPARTGLQGAPVRLALASIRRNETSPTSRMKTLGYLDTVIATGEAAARGYDDVVFRNTHGNIVCSGIGNILIVNDGAIETSPLTDGVVPGIVRNEIFQIAATEGISIVERSIPVDALRAADAVLMTNSLRLIAPVVAFEDRAIDSAAHPVFARLTRESPNKDGGFGRSGGWGIFVSTDEHRADDRAWMRWLFVVLYAGIGVMHVVDTGRFLPIMPSWVPQPRLVVFVTGLCELAGAVGLLIPRFRKAAGIGLALYAVCVFPANIKQALDHVAIPPIPDTWWYHGPRFVLQPVLVWWALYAVHLIDWPFRERGTR